MKSALIFLGIFIMLAVSGYAYFGGFIQVNCKIKSYCSEAIIAANINSNHHNNRRFIEEIFDLLSNGYGIISCKEYGIYGDYFNKKKSYEWGCIFEVKDSIKELQLNEEFNFRKINQKSYIVAEFPYKSKISIFFGIFKVYPALQKFSESNGYTKDGEIMEIYDMQNKKIQYRREILSTEKYFFLNND